jgi:uncharacterized protein
LVGHSDLAIVWLGDTVGSVGNWERLAMAKRIAARDDILEVLRREAPILKDQFKVKSIGLFGSFVRDTPRRESDIDLLVEFEESVGLFLFMDLEAHLAEVLGHKVDLVVRSALKPHIGTEILREVAYP